MVLATSDVEETTIQPSFPEEDFGFLIAFLVRLEMSYPV
jgi:hypothetical protein